MKTAKVFVSAAHRRSGYAADDGRMAIRHIISHFFLREQRPPQHTDMKYGSDEVIIVDRDWKPPLCAAAS